MKKQVHSILFTMAFGVVAVSAESDCIALSQTVTLEVSAAKSKVLEIVASHISASPNCACEVVKSAIQASAAESKEVAAIVEAAILAAPDQNRLISQCAIATAPDAASEVQAVLAKLDPNSGESADSSKSGKAPAQTEPAAETWNPLDFPGDATSVVGPRPGTNGGPTLLRPNPQFDSPPIIDTPVTDTPVITPPDPMGT